MDESCIPEAYRQLIEIREPVFAGKGIFAKQLLPKGVRILAESSCFSWENHCGYPRWDHVEDLYYAMDPQQRKAYNKLYYLDRMAPESAYSGLDPQNIIPRFMVGIFYTNKFKNAMLLAGSHFRHSCCPNVFTTEELLDNGQQVFHAIRDIQAGEELTISYINVRKTRAQRQKCLDEYEWTCHCFMCTLPKEGARVDKLLEECFKHQESQLRGLDTQEEPYWAKYYEVMKSQIESFKALGWGVEEVHRL
ncbi:SET domain-containing protein [Amniculicola lignicola CBS 123094]|uniref:SET domain-containing protein n=1 Tax=Amniculicola lignicola CBS 123094 TaxID=1392246 RepID=A0A6A5W1Y9_9PLEO|nr:SET domain-containing protein [Amniculicola lignicola CBS 123094]